MNIQYSLNICFNRWTAVSIHEGDANSQLAKCLRDKDIFKRLRKITFSFNKNAQAPQTK